jgi:preprotein translocase subunit SecE
VCEIPAREFFDLYGKGGRRPERNLVLQKGVGAFELQVTMIEKTKEFFRDVKVEMRKVVYPTRDELTGSTWVVIITVVVISVFLGFVDSGLSKIVKMALR